MPDPTDDLRCDEVLEHLDAYVDGGLSPELIARVRVHVQACDACARFGASYGQLVSALRADPPEPLPPVVLERLRERLEEAG